MFLPVRVAPGVDTEFPYRVRIVDRGVDCRDPVCRHRFRLKWSASPLFSRVWGFSRISTISRFSRFSRIRRQWFFSWLFRGPLLSRKTVFGPFSLLFRGPRFGQILRVLALEQSSDRKWAFLKRPLFQKTLF